MKDMLNELWMGWLCLVAALVEGMACNILWEE